MPYTAHQLWQQAISFAARAHAEQVRKDGQTPYVAHPLRVAMTVRHVFGCDDPVVLSIACLHDVIEDTTVDYDDLLEHFGPDVADGVAALTKDARLPEPEREAKYDEQLSRASWRARIVKLGDVYDNFNDTAPETRSKVREKARRAIACAGDAPELQAAVAVVRQLIGDA